MFYDWLKALHVIAVICWMAGLFYLPRLFVYHAMAEAEKREKSFLDTLIIMERRLYYYIMYPSLVASYLFGVWMIVENIDILYLPYMWVKILLVLGLTFVHFWLGYHRRQFSLGQNKKGHKFYRVLNEVPTVLLIGIVIMVVVKPILFSTGL